jgi:hypothetical protein
MTEEDLIHGMVQLVPAGQRNEGELTEDGFWTGPFKGVFTPFDNSDTYDVLVADVTRFRVKHNADSFRCVAALPPKGRPSQRDKHWYPPCWPLLENELEDVAGIEFVRRRFVWMSFQERNDRDGGKEWVGHYKGIFVKWDSTLPPYEEHELGEDRHGPEIPVRFTPGFRSFKATSRATNQDVNLGEFMGEVMDFSDLEEGFKLEPHQVRVSHKTKAISAWDLFGLDPETTTTDDVRARGKALDYRIGRIPQNDPVVKAMIESGWKGDLRSPTSHEERLNLLYAAADALERLTIWANCVRMDNGRVVNIHQLVGADGKSSKAQVEKAYRKAIAILVKDLDPVNDVAFKAMCDAGWSGDATTKQGRDQRKWLLKEAKAMAIELALNEGEFFFNLRDKPTVRIQAADVLEVKIDDDPDKVRAQVEQMLRWRTPKVIRKHSAGAIKALRKAGWGGKLQRSVMGPREMVILRAARTLLPNKVVDELKSELDSERDQAAANAASKPAPKRRRPQRRQGKQSAAPAAPARPSVKAEESSDA